MLPRHAPLLLSPQLAELEREEEQRAELAALEAEGKMDDDDPEADARVHALAERIRRKKGVIKATAKRDKAANHPTLPRAVAARRKKVGGLVEHMAGMGVPVDESSLANLRGRAAKSDGAAARGRSQTRKKRAGDAMDVDDDASAGVAAKKVRSNSVPRDRSVTRRDAASLARSRSPSRTGLRDEKQLKKAIKMGKKQQFKMNKFGKASESDRRIAIKKPKHLFSGKRGNGKTDRR